MLLNEFGQVILKNENIYNCKYKDLTPLLVCHSKYLDRKQIPKTWSGPIYSSCEILHHLGKHFSFFNKTQIVVKANVPREIILPGGSKINLIMTPWESAMEENVMFFLKDEYATTLITDIIPKRHFEAFVRNKVLRDNIKEGVDVLYINDAIYQDVPSTSNMLYPSESLLRALVTIVQPRFVYGLYGTVLPNCIKLSCKQIDFYS